MSRSSSGRGRGLIPVDLVTLFLASVLFQRCDGKGSGQYCIPPSSCGNIPNISYPFRLKGDPEHCGDNKYELSCENNHTILSLYSGKYYVEAINYQNYTIRLVDVGIRKGNWSSLPLNSLSGDNFIEYYYSGQQRAPYKLLKPGTLQGWVFYLKCESPVNSHLYAGEVSSSNSSFSGKKKQYSYLMHGYVEVSDVADGCSIDGIFASTRLASSHGENKRHELSYMDIHNMLADGFEVSWDSILCQKCGEDECYVDYDYTVSCYSYCYWGYKSKKSFRCLLKIYAEEFIIPVLQKIEWFLVARTSCGMLCMLLFLLYKFKRRHLSASHTIEDFLQSQANLMPIRYCYWEIWWMTKGFKDKLGQGGYGSVYKGKLRSGCLVAVKILDKSKANGQEFINEVATIGRIHHVNVVGLIGYCVERSKRALVYELMPNGSLEKYTFSNEEKISLSCEKMYEISIGVARGIEYLHRGCDLQILHFDIKPHNILLDGNFNPKVSDFGLAKLYPTNDSIVSLTAARGTMGYMAPELFYKNIGGISYKADVYSFGMLLLEMAGRRRNLNVFTDHTSQIYFPSWVYDQFKEGKEVEMGETTEEEKDMVKKMIITALWCIQLNPSDRPSMHRVLEMLEGNIEHLQMPPKPFLCPQEVPADDQEINKLPTELPTEKSTESINCIASDISAP